MRIELRPGGPMASNSGGTGRWRESLQKRSAHAGPKSEQIGHFGQGAQQCKSMQITVRL